MSATVPRTTAAAASELRLPRKRRRKESPAAALLCADPLDPRSEELLDALGEGLAEAGVASIRLSGAELGDLPRGAARLVAEGDELVRSLRGNALVDPSRIGVVGFGYGASIASVVGSREGVARVALLSPFAVEVLLRRIDRAQAEGAPPADAIRALAALQPMQSLAAALARPTLLLHGAADTEAGPEHAIAIAMALELDGRFVERLSVAFADHCFTDPAARQAACDQLAAFLDSPVDG